MKKRLLLLPFLLLFGTAGAMEQIEPCYDTGGKIALDVLKEINSYCDPKTRFALSQLNNTTRAALRHLTSIDFKVSSKRICNYGLKRLKKVLKNFNGTVNIIIPNLEFVAKNKKQLEKNKRLFLSTVKKLFNLCKDITLDIRYTEQFAKADWETLFFTKKLPSKSIPAKFTKNIKKIIFEGGQTQLIEFLSVLSKNENIQPRTHLTIKNTTINFYGKDLEKVPNKITTVEIVNCYPLYIENILKLPISVHTLILKNKDIHKKNEDPIGINKDEGHKCLKHRFKNIKLL